MAFPCISTGVYGYPAEEAARIAVRTVREWDREFPRDVIFVCFGMRDLGIYEALLGAPEEK